MYWPEHKTEYVQVTIKSYFRFLDLHTKFDWDLGTLGSKCTFEFAS